MFNPTTAQRVNERYRRLLINSGWVLPESGAELTMNYDFVAQPNLDSQVNPATGAPAGPTLDMTRNTTKTFTDWESVLRTVLAGEATFTGCRRVENLSLHSQEQGSAFWTESGSGSASIVSRTANVNIAPDGSLTAARVVLTLGGGTSTTDLALLRRAVILDVNAFYVASIYLKSNTANSYNMQIIDPDGGATAVVVTPTWQRFSTDEDFLTPAGSPNFGIRLRGGQIPANSDFADVSVWGQQIENVSGQADPSPSEYVVTTTAIAAKTFPLQKNGLPLPNAITGLLINEARTNIAVRSEDFSHATWTTTDATIDTNVAVAPDGTLTMDRLNVATTTAVHRTHQDQTIVSGDNYAVSCYIKDDGVSFAGLLFWGANTHWVTITANLTTGLITKTAVGGSSGTLISSGIDDVGNGIFRIWMVASINRTAGFIMPYTSDSATPTYDSNTGLVIYLGVAGEDLLIWGAQLEKGDFITTYIPTTTASVTRSKDRVETSDVSWYNDSEGTIYVVAIPSTIANQIDTFMSVSDGGSTNRISIGRKTGGLAAIDLAYYVQKAGDSAFLNFIGAYPTAGVITRLAGTYKVNDFSAVVDGGTAKTDFTGPVPVGVNDMTVGAQGGASLTLNGHIAQIRYYNKKGTLSEINDLSLGLLGP